MKRNGNKMRIIMGLIFAMICVSMLSVCAEAKKVKNGKVQDSQGNIYIYKNGKVRTGWFTYHGKRYYGHKTKSRMYPKGAVARNTYRVKNGKMYYFGQDGAKQTKSSRYITINRHSTSVHYIHAPGMIRRYRYNCNRRRYQYLDDYGRWVNDGEKCLPEGMIDWQE